MTTALAPSPPTRSVEEERRLVDRCLRPDTLAPRLAALAGTRPGVGCHVVDAKYEPRSTLSVLYRLGQVHVSVVAPLDGAHHPPAWGTDLGWGVRAFVFPADPVLARLPEVLDPPSLAALLAEALGEPVVACRLEVVRYRPGKRCTLAIVARLRRRGGTTPIALVGKVYANPSKAAAVFEESRRLSALVGPRSPLVLAEALALVSDVPMVLQAPVAGTPLDAVVSAAVSGAVDRRAGPGLCAAARAVAAIHDLPLVSERVRPGGAELRRFRQRADRVAEVDRHAGAALGRSVEVLAEGLAELAPARTALVHGDCKPSQFLLDGDVAAVLDFDHCGRADPASDVGALMAALRKAAVIESLDRREGRRSRATPLVALEGAFLEAYRRAGHEGDDLATRARWHQGAALVRKGLRAFARAPRSPLALALAHEARACVRSER